MTDRAVAEACFDREQDARREYSAAVAAAVEARKASRDAAFLERDRAYDSMRDLRMRLLAARPRDEAAIATIEAKMKDWRANPPEPDLSAAEAEYDRATRKADHLLDTELRRIFHDRLYASTRP